MLICCENDVGHEFGKLERALRFVSLVRHDLRATPYIFVFDTSTRVPASRQHLEVVCCTANMTERPTYQRTPSTNLAKTPAYRPHEGKFGIVTGGSRGLSRLF